MRVAVLTSSRADFGIYLPLLKALKADPFFTFEIIAFGTHLSPFHGYTVNQIIEQGFIPGYKIETVLVSDTKESIATSMGLTMMKFASFWQEHHQEFDIVFCLGDRYEMFAAVMAGIPFQIRFAHLHGGEKTLGAIDNVFRHSISHAAAIHFTSTEHYKARLTQMLDESQHVYHVGALSLDNLSAMSLLSIEEFKAKWGVDLSKPTILTTFHPETVKADLNIQYAEELAATILAENQYQYLITMPNADTAGNSIRKVFQDRLAGKEHVFLIENLGSQSYFTAMTYCSFLLGNTSSGIIEAASFGKYVINLGNRQEGRECGDNVFTINVESKLILQAISKTQELGQFLGLNVYRIHDTSYSIIDKLKNLSID